MSPAGRRREAEDPVQVALRQIEALKRRRTTRTEGAQDTPPKARTTGRRGGAAPAPAGTDDAPPPAGPEEAATPKRRGRPPKPPAAPPDPLAGVTRLTAHRPLALLEVQDAADLDALMQDPRLTPHIAARLDPLFALVLPASVERLQAALLKAGHTPKLLGTRAGGEGE
ncbi:hypothetical protein [Deinococcus aquiradiocola]|uniref:Uncharacterized protein n=1 Tax=Deinococcus aquiradiocola TaxID=393059 RepID=A0A917PRB0_9DEIO|nr:hypothetical protein [Deinococcus aquiradiocola]GGJ88681.1 hypothetical protein GCM10008939_35970 [Deinococcus aquiradiocola]